MRTFLLIAADQEALGAAPSPHTLTEAQADRLRTVIGEEDELVIAAPEEARAHYAEAEMVASFPGRMPAFEALPKVKWLHSFSAGVDRILTPAVAASDVLLSNSRGVHAVPIAEHIMGLMLTFSRGFYDTFRKQEQHRWEKAEVLGEIRGSTVLIVGLGEIGNEAARLSAALGARVLAVVRTVRAAPDYIERLGTNSDLDAMLPEADYVVITLPQTAETHHLFNAERLVRMKKSAVLINIGRGGLIDEPALVEALRAGTIAGAGLDVTETEPLPSESPLWDLPNVVITPHHSGLSLRYMERATDLLAKNIAAYLAGEPLPTQVKKELGY